MSSRKSSSEILLNDFLCNFSRGMKSWGLIVECATKQNTSILKEHNVHRNANQHEQHFGLLTSSFRNVYYLRFSVTYWITLIGLFFKRWYSKPKVLQMIPNMFDEVKMPRGHFMYACRVKNTLFSSLGYDRPIKIYCGRCCYWMITT